MVKKLADDCFICKPIDHVCVLAHSRYDSNNKKFEGFDAYELTEKIAKSADDERMYKLEGMAYLFLKYQQVYSHD